MPQGSHGTHLSVLPNCSNQVLKIEPPSAEFADIALRIRKEGLARNVLHKALYLKEDVLAGERPSNLPTQLACAVFTLEYNCNSTKMKTNASNDNLLLHDNAATRLSYVQFGDNFHAGLHSEQKALLDLLVLAHAKNYVGTKRSSFSCYARDLRSLQSKPPNSTVLIKVGVYPSEVLEFQELVNSNIDSF